MMDGAAMSALARPAKGVFWSHPVQFLRANRDQRVSRADLFDGAPLLHNVTRVDVAVIGANPVLVALAARAQARRGRRVAIGLFDGLDPWPYEMLSLTGMSRLVANFVGDAGRDLRQSLARLWSECADAAASVNGVKIADGFALSSAIPDFDGSCWFHIEHQRKLEPAHEVQASQLQQLRHRLRGLPQLEWKDGLKRIRMVRADAVILCSYDHSMVIDCAGERRDGYHQMKLSLAPKLQRVGTALRFVEDGQPWMRRAIADLVVMREMDGGDGDWESVLRGSYDEPTAC